MPKIELRKLTQKFYDDYPQSLYPEIEYKLGRPYVILLVKIRKKTFAIPFRTNIKHSSCYKFKSTKRIANSSTGLDFSKAVVIIKKEHLGDLTYIDNKEYVELQNKYYFVLKKFKKYVYDYVHYKRYGGNKYIEKRYRYTTLKYFNID